MLGSFSIRWTIKSLAANRVGEGDGGGVSYMAEVGGEPIQSLHKSDYGKGGNGCKQVTSKTRVNDMRQKVGGHCCLWGAAHRDQVWDRNQSKEEGLEYRAVWTWDSYSIQQEKVKTSDGKFEP